MKHFTVSFDSRVPSFGTLRRGSDGATTLDISGTSPVVPKNSTGFCVTIGPFATVTNRALALDMGKAKGTLIVGASIAFSSKEVGALGCGCGRSGAPRPIAVGRVLNCRTKGCTCASKVMITACEGKFVLRSRAKSMLICRKGAPDTRVNSRISIVKAADMFSSFIRVRAPTIAVLNGNGRIICPSISRLANRRLSTLSRTACTSCIRFAKGLLPFGGCCCEIIISKTAVSTVPTCAPSSFKLSKVTNKGIGVYKCIINQEALVSKRARLPNMAVVIASTALLRRTMVRTATTKVVTTKRKKVCRVAKCVSAMGD